MRVLDTLGALGTMPLGDTVNLKVGPTGKSLEIERIPLKRVVGSDPCCLSLCSSIISHLYQSPKAMGSLNLKPGSQKLWGNHTGRYFISSCISSPLPLENNNNKPKTKEQSFIVYPWLHDCLNITKIKDLHASVSWVLLLKTHTASLGL